ncbi:hypothetical protein T11_1811 [Trichinella zimbabwensis]|uniref:Uncharacterized protein n=1 Tax=Trichinella zimbabwensis TaxID=268475 RepID=A0A0V1HYA2_9BILA|nr:hypothetical protein T11_1811 [Trichinella zimbabwensis]
MTFSHLANVFLWQLLLVLRLKALVIVAFLIYNLFRGFFNNVKEKKNAEEKRMENDGPLVEFGEVTVYKVVGKILPVNFEENEEFLLSYEQLQLTFHTRLRQIVSSPTCLHLPQFDQRTQLTNKRFDPTYPSAHCL